jgi:hypothetical protein
MSRIDARAIKFPGVSIQVLSRSKARNFPHKQIEYSRLKDPISDAPRRLFVYPKLTIPIF